VNLQAERERTRRLVKRTSPASLLSDTKWRKIFAALKAPELGLEAVRVKFLGVEGEHPLTLKGVGLHPPRPFIDSLQFGPFDLISIEWLWIPARHSVLALQMLAEIGQLTIDDVGDGTRIIGHRV